MRFEREQLIRYSRQLKLTEFGLEGQRRLAEAKILIVGAGGLGAPSALYLAAMGVGRLVVADGDRVELSNLHRQLLHGTQDVGRLKVESARDALQRLNPAVCVDARAVRLAGAALDETVAEVDLVVDGSDNFETRFAVNAACVALSKPLVSGAAIRMEGQVSVFRTDLLGRACYRCLYRDEQEIADTCDANGVLPPVVGMVGSIQAMEAVKVLTGIGESLEGRLLVLDAARMQWRELKLRRDPNCPVCRQATGA